MDMLKVLSNLQGLYINAEWLTGPQDLTYFDNVSLAHSVCGDAGHPYPQGDINTDCYVDMIDFSTIGAWWQYNDCNEINDRCEKADLFLDDVIDIEDLIIFVENWLACTDPQNVDCN